MKIAFLIGWILGAVVNSLLMCWLFTRDKANYLLRKKVQLEKTIKKLQKRLENIKLALSLDNDDVL